MDSSNPEYVPASAEQYFYACKIGVQFPYVYFKRSLLDKNTTFAKFIFEQNIISKFIEVKQSHWDSAPAISINIDWLKGYDNFEVALEFIFTKLFFDVDAMRSLGFEVENDNSVS